MTELQQGIFSLIRAAMEPGGRVTLPPSFDWNAAIAVGTSHQIVPLLYYGAVGGGAVLPDAVRARLKERMFSAIMREEGHSAATARIMALFEENGIDYMPLKGTVLRTLYPRTEFRLMTDTDILIRREQYPAIRALLLAEGYGDEHETAHEFVWLLEGVMYLELHHRLFAARNRDFVRYYGDGWGRAQVSSESPHRFAMTDEDTLVYLVTHFAKHYRAAGIGIRQLLDIRVFRTAKPSLDRGQVMQTLTRLHLDRFYENIEHTLAVCFEGAEETDADRLILDRVFASGSHGTAENKTRSDAAFAVQNSGQFHHARWHWLLRRVFPPHRLMCVRYPVLKKCPVLLPFFWVVRLLCVPFSRGSGVRREMETFRALSPEVMAAQQAEYHAVGLQYAFEDEDD